MVRERLTLMKLGVLLGLLMGDNERSGYVYQVASPLEVI